MSPFEILQIGEDVEPTAGIPDACDLCGHCRMLRSMLPDGARLPCGAARPGPYTAARLDDARRERRSPGQTTRGAN